MLDNATEKVDDDYAFRRLCSDLTLQTKKEGFFKDYLATIADEVTPEQYEEFAKKKTDQERILYCWTLPALHKVLPAIRPIYKAKSAEDAIQKRELGNEAFKARDYFKALIFYNQSVIYAPYSSLLEKTTMAMALANRSAALVHLKHYELAVRDIHLSLQSNYPEAQRYKLYDRLAYCYQQLGEPSKASLNWTIGLDCLDQSELAPQAKAQWRANIEKSMKSNSNNKAKAVEQDNGKGREPDLIDGPQRDFPSASRALKLITSEGSGRYFVANQDIKPAETLVAEEPYAACLLPNKFGTHCHHCFARLVAPLGCMTCRGVGYCSAKCRDAAGSTYHQYECGIIDILTASGVSILSWIALRILTQGNLDEFLEKRGRLEQLEENPSEIPRLNNRGAVDYERVYQLATLSHLRKDKDFFDRTFMAIFLFQCLRASGYLPMAQNRHVQDPQSITDDEVFIATLILRHLQFLQFNAHEIHEFVQANERSMKTTKTIYIGVGIYPTVAYFNHSCRPDVTRYFMGKKLVITSSRSVKRGQMVAENYGPIFTHKGRADRLTSLQGRYWFKCACPACEKNWPSYDAMPDLHNVLSCCPFCRGRVKAINAAYVKCVSCKKLSTLDAVRRPVNELDVLYQTGLKVMDEGQVEKAVELLAAFIDTVEAILPEDRPVRELLLAQEALRLCLGTYGTTYSAVDTLSLRVAPSKNKQPS